MRRKLPVAVSSQPTNVRVARLQVAGKRAGGRLTGAVGRAAGQLELAGWPVPTRH